jgi:hypothetical protein
LNKKEKGPAGPCLGKLGLPCEVLLPLLSAGPGVIRAARSYFTRSRTPYFKVYHNTQEATHEHNYFQHGRRLQPVNKKAAVLNA